MNYKHLADIYIGENEFNREKMQFFFDKSFRENDETLLRNQYIALRQLQFNDFFEFSPKAINLSSLVDNITIACDILSAGTGVNFIYCGAENVCVSGSENLITKCLLNLLSNAYLYGTENLITTKCVKYNSFTSIEVLSGGPFLENPKDGKGITFVRNATNQMGGKFFIEQSSNRTRAVIMLRHSADYAEKDYDFLDFINDRLSPVCVEMFGMAYNECGIKA